MISWHNDPNGYDDDADTSASWAVHEWTDAVLSVTDSQSVVHRRLVAGNSINSVTLYGHEGLLPETLDGASYSLAFDNRVMTLYDRDAEPRDHFATYDDAVYAMLTHWAELPLPQSGADQVRNGDFAPEAVDRLGWDNDRPHGWYVNHLIPHATGTGPLQKRRVIENGEDSALYLYTQSAKYGAGGANNVVSEVWQILDATPGLIPQITFDMMIPVGQYVDDARCSPYFAVTGFNSSQIQQGCSIAYTRIIKGWSGNMINAFNVVEDYSLSTIIAEEGTWYHDLAITPSLIYDASKEPEWDSWEQIGVDRLILHFGVFNFNLYSPLQHQDAPTIGVLFDNIRVTWEEMGRFKSEQIRVYSHLPSPKGIVLSGIQAQSEHLGCEVYLDEITISWEPVQVFLSENEIIHYRIDFFYPDIAPAFTKTATEGHSMTIRFDEAYLDRSLQTDVGLEFYIQAILKKDGRTLSVGEESAKYRFKLVESE